MNNNVYILDLYLEKNPNNIKIPQNKDTVMIPPDTDLLLNVLTDNPHIKQIRVHSWHTEYASFDGAVYTKDKKELLYAAPGQTSLTLADETIAIEQYSLCHSGLNLQAINVPASNPFLASFDGAVYTKDKKTLLYAAPRQTSLTLADETTAIEHDTLCHSDSNLQAINVPASNPFFASFDGAVYNKKMDRLIYCPAGRSTLQFPASVKQIGIKAFADNTNLTDITLPEGITRIGIGAFLNCKNLKHLHLPSTLERIDNDAFTNCKSLEELYLPDEVAVLERNTLDGCSSLKKLHLPENLIEIKDYNITYNLTSLTELTLPKNLELISRNAIQHNDNLEHIYVHPDNPYFTMQDGILYSKDMSELVFYPHKKEGGFVIPASVKHICSNAFTDCSKLTSVTLPARTDLVIDSCAFYRCTNLADVYASGCYEYAGPSAFAYSGLQRITIDGTVISLDVLDNDYANIILMHAADTFRHPDYLQKLPERICYNILTSFYRNDVPETVEYMKKRILKAGKYAVTYGDRKVLMCLISNNLLTKAQTDKLLQLAIDKQKHELYLELLEYKKAKFNKI